MRINWLGYQFRDHDGYGRYGTRCIAALMRAGVAVQPAISEAVAAPAWLHRLWGLDWDDLTISCLPPAYLKATPGGRHWLYTMTEGSELPPGWADWIKDAHIERLIVPCQHNAEAFARGGVPCPIHVIPGGTDPDEFPAIVSRETNRPYTFLALADRGARKGWTEVYQAFYQAFGSPANTPDVRLIIKSRPEANELLGMIAKAQPRDPRLEIMQCDMHMPDFYRLGDCLAIPSRSEGWGMPHREAAMMGLPVITQAYSGMDDGHTAQWATVVEGEQPEPIPSIFEHIAGMWRRADVPDLAREMRWHYENPDNARSLGRSSSEWLRENQTWDHTAGRLIGLMREYS